MHIRATSKKMKQKCDIGGQISNQIDHNKFSIFLIRVHQSLRNKYWYKDKKHEHV